MSRACRDRQQYYKRVSAQVETTGMGAWSKEKLMLNYLGEEALMRSDGVNLPVRVESEVLGRLCR
jgi:hypothetical protein